MMLKNNNKIVISMGGSIFSENNPATLIKKYAEVIAGMKDRYNLYIVTGGGYVARKFIDLGRILGGSDDILDDIGILSSRLNGYLLVSALSDKIKIPLSRTFADSMMNGSIYGVSVMGGVMPGITTDGVSALLAEYVGSGIIINATNVNGVYNKDPKKYKNAKMIKHMNYDELIDLIETSRKLSPGRNNIFDDFGAKIARRSNIKIVIVNGGNVANIESAIKGTEKTGTVVDAN